MTDATMTDAQYPARLQPPLAGSIQGMWRNAKAVVDRECGAFLPINHAVVFDVATRLAAAATESHNAHRHVTRTGSAHGTARAAYRERKCGVRPLNEARGTSIIFTPDGKAAGEQPAPHSSR